MIHSIPFLLNHVISEKKIYLGDAAFFQRTLIHVSFKYEELIQLHGSLRGWKDISDVSKNRLFGMLQDYAGYFDRLSNQSTIENKHSRKHAILSEPEIQIMQTVSEEIGELNVIKSNTQSNSLQENWIKMMKANEDYVNSNKVIQKHQIISKYIVHTNTEKQ
ncbi:hypothetical protein AWM70_18060 [Paenibacillus yonginensis]|uniref:Uncharacterized protein n=1 Tax=Paenibacillus yonginensis TaxID=1462996 RepID=A0A1B1N497_9BACL|nr:hypothetical protein [Paenibacillus yonginensis]ANS76253.1 hypothetical protein AWM70_18060 [Paenibacillus yonginensis]